MSVKARVEASMSAQCWVWAFLFLNNFSWVTNWFAANFLHPEVKDKWKKAATWLAWGRVTVGKGGWRVRGGGRCTAGEEQHCWAAGVQSTSQWYHLGDLGEDTCQHQPHTSLQANSAMPESVIFYAVAGEKALPGIRPKQWYCFSALLSRRWEICPVNVHSHALTAFE